MKSDHSDLDSAMVLPPFISMLEAGADEISEEDAFCYIGQQLQHFARSRSSLLLGGRG